MSSSSSSCLCLVRDLTLAARLIAAFDVLLGVGVIVISVCAVFPMEADPKFSLVSVAGVFNIFGGISLAIGVWERKSTSSTTKSGDSFVGFWLCLAFVRILAAFLAAVAFLYMSVVNAKKSSVMTTGALSLLTLLLGGLLTHFVSVVLEFEKSMTSAEFVDDFARMVSEGRASLNNDITDINFQISTIQERESNEASNRRQEGASLPPAYEDAVKCRDTISSVDSNRSTLE